MTMDIKRYFTKTWTQEMSIRVLDWIYEYVYSKYYEDMLLYIESEFEKRNIPYFPKSCYCSEAVSLYSLVYRTKSRLNYEELLEALEKVSRHHQFNKNLSYHSSLIKFFCLTKLQVVNKKDPGDGTLKQQLVVPSWKTVKCRFNYHDDDFKNVYVSVITQAHKAIEEVHPEPTEFDLQDHVDEVLQREVDELRCTLETSKHFSFLDKMIDNQELQEFLTSKTDLEYRLFLKSLKENFSEASLMELITVMFSWLNFKNNQALNQNGETNEKNISRRENLELHDSEQLPVRSRMKHQVVIIDNKRVDIQMPASEAKHSVLTSLVSRSVGTHHSEISSPLPNKLHEKEIQHLEDIVENLEEYTLSLRRILAQQRFTPVAEQQRYREKVNKCKKSKSTEKKQSLYNKSKGFEESHSDTPTTASYCEYSQIKNNILPQESGNFSSSLDLQPMDTVKVSENVENAKSPHVQAHINREFLSRATNRECVGSSSVRSSESSLKSTASDITHSSTSELQEDRVNNHSNRDQLTLAQEKDVSNKRMRDQCIEDQDFEVSNDSDDSLHKEDIQSSSKKFKKFEHEGTSSNQEEASENDLEIVI